MFENLSKKITSFFIEKNIITKDKEEMCNYSVFCRLSTLFTSFSIIFIGYISIGVLNAAIFTLTFLSIRKNSGGYQNNFYEDGLIQFVNTSYVGAAMVGNFRLPMRTTNGVTYNSRYLKVTSQSTPVSDGYGTSKYCAWGTSLQPFYIMSE